MRTIDKYGYIKNCYKDLQRYFPNTLSIYKTAYAHWPMPQVILVALPGENLKSSAKKLREMQTKIPTACPGDSWGTAWRVQSSMPREHTTCSKIVARIIQNYISFIYIYEYVLFTNINRSTKHS